MLESIVIFQIIILVFSIVIHEFSHGWMANYLGDPTAKYAGRLTLNPMAHLDLWGSFLIPFMLIVVGSPVLFGWAKPVPYNPYNLKNQKYGPALVGLAGPGANFLVAIIFGLALRFLITQGINSTLIPFFSIIVLINIILAVFNLVPIPPLDGSKILSLFIPSSLNEVFERYGLVLLIFFIFFALPIIFPIISGIYGLIVGQSLAF